RCRTYPGWRRAAPRSSPTAGRGRRRVGRPSLRSHRHAGGGEVRLDLADAERAEMKDRGGENRGGMPVANAVDEVIERSHPTRRDHRYPHRIRRRAGQRDVESGFGAVAVHRGRQQFSGAVIGETARPFDRVEPGRVAPAMGEDTPFARARLLGVDGADDALAAEFIGRLTDEIWP